MSSWVGGTMQEHCVVWLECGVFFVKLAVFEVWSLLAFWLLRVYRSMLV